MNLLLSILLALTLPLIGGRIVYSADAEAEMGIDAALALQGEIKAACGVELPIVSDADGVKKGDICLEVLPTGLGCEADTFDYEISSSKGVSHIKAGGCWALGEASKIYAYQLAKGKKAGRIRSRGNIRGRFLFPRPEGVNLRILDCNVWDFKPDTLPTVWKELGQDCRNAHRFSQLAAVVDAYAPDVFSMQECPEWMQVFIAPHLESSGYVTTYPDSDGVTSHTPIFYKPSELELLESSYHSFKPAKWNNKGSKSFNTAIFRHRDSGRIFAVVTTHLWWKNEKDAPGSDAARAAQVRTIMKAADKLVSKYDCPIFLMGDMNTQLSSQALQQLVTAGYVPAWKAATDYGDDGYSHHMCSTAGFSRDFKNPGLKPGEKHIIDHFFIYNAGQARIREFRRIRAWFVVPVSDHFPNYADITL